MTELSSITEARRKALDALLEEVDLASKRLRSAYETYANRLAQLARHDRLGMPDLSRPKPVIAGRPHLFNREEEERYICQPYWEAKRHADTKCVAGSVRKLAAHLGCHRLTVDRALKRFAERYPELVAKFKAEESAAKARRGPSEMSAARMPNGLSPKTQERLMRQQERIHRAPPLKPDTTWDDDIPKATPESRARERAERERKAAEAAPQKRSLEDMAFDDAELYGETNADR